MKGNEGKQKPDNLLMPPCAFSTLSQGAWRLAHASDSDGMMTRSLASPPSPSLALTETGPVSLAAYESSPLWPPVTAGLPLAEMPTVSPFGEEPGTSHLACGGALWPRRPPGPSKQGQCQLAPCSMLYHWLALIFPQSVGDPSLPTYTSGEEYFTQGPFPSIVLAPKGLLSFQWRIKRIGLHNSKLVPI